MEINVKEVLFLAIFIVLGVVLFNPIISTVHYITSPTVTVGNTTQSNPSYVGATNANLVNLIPVFYLVVLIVVPAVIAYKTYKD